MINGRTKIIISMAIWGSVGIFARYSNLSGLKLAFYRVLLGSLIFLFFYTLNDYRWIKKAFSGIKPKLHLVFLLGAVLGLNWVFFLFRSFIHRHSEGYAYLLPGPGNSCYTLRGISQRENNDKKDSLYFHGSCGSVYNRYPE